MEAYLCLSLAFDAFAFLGITYGVVSRARNSGGGYHLVPVLKVVQRDGIMYFFVLFSSNLVWLLLLLHAPVGFFAIHPYLALLTFR